MISRFALTAIAGIFLATPVTIALPQGHSPVGGGMSASTVGTSAGAVNPGTARGVVGSGGSAATGGTSASSLGLGAESTAPGQSSSALATGGSAASANDGHMMSRSGMHGNGNALNGQSMDQAHQRGSVWSKSHTVTHLHNGDLTSRTKSMAHEPGGPPVKSTTGSSVDLGR
jgi:hypothetical protein